MNKRVITIVITIIRKLKTRNDAIPIVYFSPVQTSFGRTIRYRYRPLSGIAVVALPDVEILGWGAWENMVGKGRNLYQCVGSYGLHIRLFSHLYVRYSHR